ncbi:MAG: VanW family protein [Patescibacteria group bacterium]
MPRLIKEKKINPIIKTSETKKSLKEYLGDWRSRFFAGQKAAAVKKNVQKILTGAVILLLVILITGLFYYAYQKSYSAEFYRGARLTDIDLSGQTLAEARQLLAEKIDAFSDAGLTIAYQTKKINLPASIAATPDSAVDLFSFSPDDSLNRLFAAGRSNNIFKNIIDQLWLFIFSPREPLAYYLDENKLRTMLKENFGKMENTARDAEIVFINGKASVSPEQYGKAFDYNLIVAEIKTKLALLDNQPLTLILKTDYPKIYAAELNQDILKQAEKILALAPITLTASSTAGTAEKKWLLDKNQFASVLGANQSTADQAVTVGLKPQAFADYLQTKIAPAVLIEPTDAKFQLTGGRVTEFKASHAGQKLNADATMARLENALLTAEDSADTGPLTIAIVIDEIASSVTSSDASDLGIKEIIGTGESNYAGSPSNRRHNIAVGAAAVNGTLIKPGGEFSLLKTLGKVDAGSGYLPELVIKENKTTPEYGGGLCQIGTTAFRAALASGLPITERRNHSYRVAYYEPAGTDATIYDPAPDFKFKNDTANYILIQSRLEGNNIYFDFWGTRDGRAVDKAKPKIYNIVAPPAAKIIETTELKPGEKKCTEKAHAGADASLSYKVTYPDGKLNEQIFASHYRPWQEVCLIGVTASSTPETIVTPEVIENNIPPVDQN